MKYFTCSLLVFLLIAHSGFCHAAELLISPVNIDIAPGEKSALLKLQNNSDSAIRIQIRVKSWDTEGDDDDIKPRHIVVSPSSVNIQPGKQQIVRLVNIGPPSNADKEQLYRVILDEIPNFNQPAEQGLVLRVRYALPLFVGGPDLSTRRTDNIEKLTRIWQQSLSYHFNPATQQLILKNLANGHARVSKVRIVDATGHETVVFAGLLGYVLAGDEAAFPVNTIPRAKDMQLHAEVNGILLEIPANGR